ncbi:MAG: Crp/Fnr family transcriptional regulator [Paludibacteraceae bacterium]|nr:Crp/Fnr family transcriptional regulator [Paludibacteraceae bacterium]
MSSNEPNARAILQQKHPWNLLSDSELNYMIEHSAIRHVKKNGYIYGEGEQPTHLIIVLSGKVKIFKTGMGGRNQIVRFIKADQLLGYRAMFAGEKYVTTATAFEPSIVLEVPEAVVRRLIHDNPDLSFAFIHFLSVDLGIADARSVVLTQSHVRGRLAESLLHLKDNFGLEADGSGTLAVTLSREDLASLSNMTTSNAIRTLAQLSKEGILEVKGRKIRILDEDRLQRISKFE